jgi:ketosteroid isomerase-like protein
VPELVIFAQPTTGLEIGPKSGHILNHDTMNPIFTRASFFVIAMFSCALPAARAHSELHEPAKAAAENAIGRDALKAQVAGMENAFCAMAKAKGLRAAFEHFAAPDVAFIDTDPRKFRGLEAVRKRIGADTPGASLTWSAMFTDVSDDGTLEYNWGRYEWRGPGAEGKPVVRGGFFLTIWKRQPDGSWRYVMDSGAPDRPAAGKK